MTTILVNALSKKQATNEKSLFWNEFVASKHEIECLCSPTYIVHNTHHPEPTIKRRATPRNL
ncbi:hypothetical protein ACHAWX_002203 [Stephanocyclus meneghinianus]